MVVVFTRERSATFSVSIS
ncbi:unnamed protein product [Victoria cruziana]